MPIDDEDYYAPYDDPSWDAPVIEASELNNDPDIAFECPNAPPGHTTCYGCPGYGPGCWGLYEGE